jgi:hypothetical protein
VVNDHIYIEDIDIGDEVPELITSVSMDQVSAFFASYPRSNNSPATPSRFNSDEQAKKEGLAGPIIPGVMSMALITKVLTDWGTGAKFKLLDAIFRQVVPQGESIRAYAVITDKDEANNTVELDVYIEPMDGQPYVRGRASMEVASRNS